MPLARTHSPAPGLWVGIWEIAETEEALWAMLGPDADERARLEGLRPGARRRHWLAARVLALRLLGTRAPFRLDEAGRPFLAGRAEAISLSHAGDRAAAAVGSRGPVGIDLERVGPDVLGIASRFLSPAERLREDGADAERLTVHWCAKEAVYKLLGEKGLSFRAMTIGDFAWNGSARLLVETGDRRIAVHAERDGDHVLAYALPSG